MRSTAGQDFENFRSDRQSTLLAESLRSFLDKSGKRKEERGKREEESGKRKEEKERGKRKEERGKRKKVLNVTKHGAQRKPNAKLEIDKAFQDRSTFLNRHMIV